MKSTFRYFASRIRHVPGLKSADSLWDLLRPAYHRILNLGGSGVPMAIGREPSRPGVVVRMPAEFSGGEWSSYEPECIEQLRVWIATHPKCLLIDVGCSVGIYSLVALSLSRDSRVVAIDSDLASLKATQRMCQHADAERLRVVQGFITEHSDSGANLDEAVAQTLDLLSNSQVTGDAGTTRFQCIGDDKTDSIASHTLDALFPPESVVDRPLLIKCDIEGAELYALSGAKEVIRRLRPQLLLSVHPVAMRRYGHSDSEVTEFLKRNDYTISVVAVDHEEHWWCSPL